ncbi:MAG: ATPase, T2SS/T4P/T4SS family [Desulfobacterales bacterium]|jgi:type IV pilus assembly protein PilB
MKTDLIPKRIKLGEILISQEKITPEELEKCLLIQKNKSQPLGQILLQEGFITEEDLQQVLIEQLGIHHVWLRKGLVDPRIVNVLPKEKALAYKVIPMFRVHNVLTIATADPHAFFVFDEISKITHLKVQPVACRSDDILEAIHECYQMDVAIDDVMGSIDESELEIIRATSEEEISELAELADGSPVINLVNTILLRSIRDGASDIHIEPQRGKFRVRVRIDGVLYDLISPKIELHPAVVSRLKVMANLDIAERRIPQDGRIQVNVAGSMVDLRFSSMPGIHGEKVVLRILDKSQAILDIDILGFDSEVLNRFKSLLRRPYGLILVCGPTGSGKTTTLYSAITMLNSSEKNFVTIEDPVEYQLENINQIQVKESIGFTFAKVLKHTLRQDPDIILVGEIRDRETALTAIQASLTGHLVLSTLHTNDAPSAMTRLLEMEIASYLISSSLLASLGQRLVRKICPECRTNYYAPKEVLKTLAIAENKIVQLFKGKGCSNCYDSGFKSRTGIYELLELDQGLQSLILNNPTVDEIHHYLHKNGHKSLKSLGYQKVIEGVTTMEEAVRVTSMGT